MSDDYKNLPSIDDYVGSEILPSLSDLIQEEDLPSIEEYIVEEKCNCKCGQDPCKKCGKTHHVKEDTQTIENLEGETFAEVKDIVPPWPELLRLVNDVKESIPEIPEIKSYDNELQELLTHIEQVKESIPEVPEVRYYEDDIESLKESIDDVRANIPKFPKWVNEVNEVPDFSWIGKTFSVIDDDFDKVNDNLRTLKDTFNQDIQNLTESFDTKDFEKKVEIKEVKDYLQETKNKIYDELKETALKIYEYRNQFKDDDRLLKKNILSKLNEAKQNIEKKIDESNSKYRNENKEIKNYFNGLKEEVANLPEVKYYDKDIKKLREKAESHSINISELYKIVEEIKGTQKNLSEEIVNNRPIAPDPSEKQGNDPLTPTDQKFATLQDLAANYRLFVNRVEQQLYTIGGGGAGFIKDLDDVSFDQTTGTNELLIYSGNKWVGIASTALGSSTLTGLDDVDDSNLGDGRFLRYNATEEEFTFEPVSATNLELIAGDIQSGVKTTSATGQAVVMSISASTYRSVSYQIQAVQGSNYNMTTINVVHDGTNTYMNEFGTINQPTGIATFSTDINSGALRLLGFPASSSSTTFKVVFTALQV
tara:strand:+ start:968 stop:2746 length:1779 start_codon:yes stop_codon:yes gene_type:complete